MNKTRHGIIEEDPKAIGVTFIDFLFAFVISKIFELSTMSGLRLVSYSHLILATTVTTVSWIGYRGSRSRRSYRISFFNLPLLQLLVELTHLYLYWLLATTAEYQPSYWTSSPRPSLLPEVFLLLAIFALYVVWDRIALEMRKSGRYVGLTIVNDRPQRRAVTVVMASTVGLCAFLSIFLRSHNQLVVLIGDFVMITIVIGHRAIQNRVSRD